MRLRCIGQNFTSALRLYVLEHRKNTTIFKYRSHRCLFLNYFNSFLHQSAVFMGYFSSLYPT